jgi:hypothetical protein
MKRTAWAWVLLVLPAAGFGQGLDYTYVEGRFISSEINVGPFDADGDSIAVIGSLSVGRRYHLFASYKDYGVDFNNDATTFAVGGGIHHALSSEWDLIGEVSYVNAHFDNPGRGDDDGIGLTGGVRGRFTPKVEFDAGLDYVDLNRSNTSLFARGRYYLNSRLAVGGGITLDDGDSALMISIRGVFGGL